jgi:hypothetical protein
VKAKSEREAQKVKKVGRYEQKIDILWRKSEVKIVKVANEVDRKRNSPSPITRHSADNLSPTHHNNNNCTKMPPASSPPVLSSWAPILFPPWNSGLLPAAFYPAALRSLPT